MRFRPTTERLEGMHETTERLDADRAEVLAAEGTGPRRFRMVAYSGAEIDRWYGRLMIDLSGIKAEDKLAILLEHDDSKRVGVCDKRELTNEGLVLSGYFLENDHAKEVLKDADKGFPFKCSIGIRDMVLEEVTEGAEAQCNGKTLRGPVTVARKAHLYETSFITCLPADKATKAEVFKETTMDLKALLAMLKANPELATKLMSELGGKDSQAEVVAAFKARADEILEAFPERPKFAMRMIREGKTLVEAKAALADRLLEKERKAKAAAPKAVLGYDEPKGEKTVLADLKAKARHRGLGFAGPEREQADGSGGELAVLEKLPVAERAKVEIVTRPNSSLVTIYEMLAGALPGYTAEKLYAKVLELDRRRRADGRPFFNADVVAQMAYQVREWADHRYGPLYAADLEKTERFGSWGKSNPDMSGITVKGFMGSFYAAFEEEMDRDWVNQVAFRSDSDQETETHKWLGFFPMMREWIGNRQEKGLPLYEFAIKNRLYEATVPVDKNDARFQKFNLINMRFGEAGAVAAQHWAKLVSDLIIANGLTYDGQNYFDTDHTLGGDSGTMSNDLAVGDYPALNFADPDSPTESEFAAALLQVTPHLRTYKTNNGEPLNGGMRRVLVMVPPNMEGAALAAVASKRLNYGQDNPLQAGQRLSWDIVVNARLTSTTVFYIFRTDSRAKPFITQEPAAIEMLFQGPGSTEEFVRHRFLMGLEATRAAGYGEWTGALRLTAS